jgi:hypothetical protein
VPTLDKGRRAATRGRRPSYDHATACTEERTVSLTGPPEEAPAVRVSDADREIVVTRLQTAVAEGRIDLDEFAQRVDAAYTAATSADLQVLLADLPAPGAQQVEIVGQSMAVVPISTVFGDIKISGAASVPARATTVFGDIRLDLRDLRTDADVVDLELGTVFGDVEVIVAEGVAAEIAGWTVFGDRKVELAALPRLAGTPRIRVRGRTVFGDLELRSLAPGESASRWRAVLDRLAARAAAPQVPPQPPATP